MCILAITVVAFSVQVLHRVTSTLPMRIDKGKMAHAFKAIAHRVASAL